jgi:hypothetical protein
MIVKTMSGSVYEIDEDNKRVRKSSLKGTEMLPVHEWKDYESVFVDHNNCLVIVWNAPGKIIGDLGNRATVSTPLVDIPEFKN